MSKSKQQLITRAFITPECRENRGDEGAWEEAVRRLRTEYDAVLAGWADADEKPTFALMLFYERPIPDETAPVIPPFFAGSESAAATQPPSPQAQRSLEESLGEAIEKALCDVGLQREIARSATLAVCKAVDGVLGISPQAEVQDCERKEIAPHIHDGRDTL